jgi:hypothetical protein
VASSAEARQPGFLCRHGAVAVMADDETHLGPLRRGLLLGH